MSAAAVMRLDPLALKKMTLSEFHAYARGFAARQGTSDPAPPSESEFISMLVDEFSAGRR